MNPEVFWSAFGAIGTTLGSLITAIAVVVAVRQYRQPLHKRIKITFSSAFALFANGHVEDHWQISVANIGIRDINISNIMLSIEKKHLLLLTIQPSFLTQITFPLKLHPEQSVDFSFNPQKLAIGLKEAIEKGDFALSSKVRVVVTDKSDDRYYKSTKRRVRDFIKA